MSRAAKIWIVLGLTLIGMVSTVAVYGPLKLLGHIFFLTSEDTEYAPGYSEVAFREIEVGDSEADVRAALGEPISEVESTPSVTWLYTDRPFPEFTETGEFPDMRSSFTSFRFESGRCVDIFGQVSGGTAPGGATLASVGPGVNSLSITGSEVSTLETNGAVPADIEKLYGPPTGVHHNRAVKWLLYSHSPGSTNYRKRRIAIDANGQVCRKDGDIYWD